MKNLVRALVGICALAAPGAALAQERCVHIAGQDLEPAEVYSARHVCSTCPGQRDNPNLCNAANRLMVPYWSKPADLVSIPHRGLWGQPLSAGASENTMAAIKQAVASGYRVIEIDVTFTGPDAQGNKDVFLGHYFSMACCGGDPNRAPSDYSPSQVTAFRMNKRSQAPSTDPEDALLLLKPALEYAKQQGVLLMVDPKEPPNSAPDYLEQVIAKTLEIANDVGALSNVAIKTSSTYGLLKDKLVTLTGGRIKDWEGKFLWSPITATSPQSRDLNSILAFLIEWDNHTDNSKGVATYEVSLFSPDYFGAKPFTIGESNYANLVDYVKRLTPLGKRSAFWSIDPMGDKGTFSRVYTWKFIGNTADDKRGSPVTNLSYWGGSHVAINTDRPAQYDSFVVDPYK